jgi:phage tail-like protein
MYTSEPKEVGRWTFTEAWPSKWSVSDLDAGSDDLMIESVTLTIELLKREK